MRKKKLFVVKKNCFLCYNFSFKEFTVEDSKTCAKNWMVAENCPNWKPVSVFVEKEKIFLL